MTNQRKPRKHPRRTVAIAALSAGLALASVPAWAYWRNFGNFRLPTIEVGSVAFAISTQDEPAKHASTSGEPVTIELDGTRIEQLISDAPEGELPVWAFTITGWADSARGLAYTLTADLDSEVPALIYRGIGNTCPQPDPAATGQRGQVQVAGGRDVQLQPVGKSGNRATSTAHTWCVAIPPVKVGDYHNRAEVLDASLSPSGQDVYAFADWNAVLAEHPTPAEGAASHLTVVATPQMKEK